MINKDKPDYGFLDYFGLQEPFKYPEWVAAAQNTAISTDDLIQFALEGMRDEREGKEDVHNRALLVLQQRVTQEVFNAVSELCRNSEPEARQLGAKILREFSDVDFEKPFKEEALKVLENLVMNELDEEVLVWGVSAIGWQRDTKAIPLLLRFVDHPSNWVRFMVANNLIVNCEEYNPFPPEVAEAYKKLYSGPRKLDHPLRRKSG